MTGPRQPGPAETAPASGVGPAPPIPLAGDGIAVPCADGTERPYLSLDAAASTSALGPVLTRVEEFIPWYSSVHRGAGYKSQVATRGYENARSAALAFARRSSPGGAGGDVAIICRNTTEALNHLAYQLRLSRDDVVVTTVAEHHANLLPWIGWPSLTGHERRIAGSLRRGLASIPGVRLLGPGTGAETLPVAAFTVDGVSHALVAARLAAEDAIGVRHGCFCAHPYLMRLLGLTRDDVHRYRGQVRRGDRSQMPGAVRASAGINTTGGDIARLLDAVARIARGDPPPVPYRQDPRTGDYYPCGGLPAGLAQPDSHQAPCSPG